MEKFLPLTKIFGVTGKVFPFPKPYWQHLLWVHRIIVKLGVRCLLQAGGVPAQLREYLKLQIIGQSRRWGQIRRTDHEIKPGKLGLPWPRRFLVCPTENIVSWQVYSV